MMSLIAKTLVLYVEEWSLSVDEDALIYRGMSGYEVKIPKRLLPNKPTEIMVTISPLGDTNHQEEGR